jgi:hypothetical protein
MNDPINAAIEMLNAITVPTLVFTVCRDNHQNGRDDGKHNASCVSRHHRR